MKGEEVETLGNNVGCGALLWADGRHCPYASTPAYRFIALPAGVRKYAEGATWNAAYLLPGERNCISALATKKKAKKLSTDDRCTSF